MKVLAITILEDCFDGSYRKEMVLDQEISEAFIHYMGLTGTLQYFPHFARPFFRIDGPRFMLKGILNNSYMQLLVFDQAKETELLHHITHYKVSQNW